MRWSDCTATVVECDTTNRSGTTHSAAPDRTISAARLPLMLDAQPTFVFSKILETTAAPPATATR